MGTGLAVRGTDSEAGFLSRGLGSGESVRCGTLCGSGGEMPAEPKTRPKGESVTKNHYLSEAIKTLKTLHAYEFEYSSDFLARTGRGVDRPRIRPLLLRPDEAAERGERDHANHCRTRPQGRNGLPETTVQDRRDRFSGPVSLLCRAGLWVRGAEPVGAVRFPDRRLLLGAGRIYRHENGDVCFGENGAGRFRVVGPGAESRFPIRCRDGAGGRRARAARHLGLVPRLGMVL